MKYRRMLIALAAPAMGFTALAGCSFSTGIPGAPDITLEVPESNAQKACKEYARAFNATSRETITDGLTNAQSIAASGDDTDSANLAAAIDEVLANTVVGTQDSLYAANATVLSICSAAGVNITME